MDWSTISGLQARSILEENKDKLDLHTLGFVTTVIRDNELDEQLYDYYQAVLNLVTDVIKNEKGGAN